MGSPSKPDYKEGVGLYGGKLAEIARPHVRKFPGPQKREVAIRVVQLFRHFHIKIKEEFNPIWNGSTWQQAWDDDAGEGQFLVEFKSTSREAAKAWIAKMVAKHFPASSHITNDWLGFLVEDERELPDYIQVARAAARRASRREGD
jgi:hypothetical protein